MIIEPNTGEKYDDYIQRLLQCRVNIKDENIYQERHHILPRALGGEDIPENLIYLYAQEHYFAHKLLALENSHNQKLQFAWWNMCQCIKKDKRKYKVSAEEYAIARENAAKAVSQQKKGKPLSDTHKQHLKETHGKPVINITTGEKYASSKEAGEKTGIHGRDINECCNGKRGSAGRDSENNIPFIWRFIGEEDKDFGFKTFYFQKEIICVETGVVYQSIHQASDETGIRRGTISNDCKHKSSKRQTNRLHFCFLNDYNKNNSK